MKNKNKFLDKYYSKLKDHDNEHFKFITYPMIKNNYVVSNYGKIINFNNNHILKPHHDKDGYLRVMIPSITGKSKTLGIHRLVAWEFCPKIEGCDIVNHIDADVTNNYYKNLEWTTVKGNTQHAMKLGLTIRSGCNANNASYNQETVDKIISELKSGKNVYEVYNIFYPESDVHDHREFYMLIYRILRKESHPDDVKDIQFPDSCYKSNLKEKWDDEDVSVLIDMIKNGLTNREIFNYYKLTDRTDSRHVRLRDKLNRLRETLDIPNYDPASKLRDEIKDMVKQGLTNKEILDYYGIKTYRSKGASTIAHNATKFRRELQEST